MLQPRCWSTFLVSFPAFHFNLTVSTPEAKSLNYTAVYSSLNDTSCLCGCHCSLRWYAAIVSDVCESLHQGQSTITVYKPCRANQTRANTTVSTALFKTQPRQIISDLLCILCDRLHLKKLNMRKDKNIKKQTCEMAHSCLKQGAHGGIVDVEENWEEARVVQREGGEIAAGFMSQAFQGSTYSLGCT